jgi:hypothetical protein
MKHEHDANRALAQTAKQNRPIDAAQIKNAAERAEILRKLGV